MIYLPISFRVASLALGQSYDCPSASEATLKDMGTIDHYLSATKACMCEYLWDVYYIGRTCRHGYLDYTLKPHCTIPPPTTPTPVGHNFANNGQTVHETMGSEWPDKHNKTAFGNVVRCGEDFFSSGHPPWLNHVASGVVWATGLFFLWLPWLIWHNVTNNYTYGMCPMKYWKAWQVYFIDY